MRQHHASAGLARAGLIQAALALLLPVSLGLGVTGLGLAGFATAASAAAQLTPHRAIYDLKLSKTRGSSSMSGVRGRIVYDFSGNACEGFQLEFRQLSELDSGEGKTSMSDLRTSTWEDGSAKNYRFNSQNFVDQKLVDTVDGKAERSGQAVDVNLSKPQAKKFPLDATMVFPTEHMRRIIDAAKAEKTILEFPVYDGAETGEKVYNTLTVIGRPIAPGARKPEDAAATNAVLDGLVRWPVTISYFDRANSSSKDGGGEQTPVYSIAFELYENGVSRALTLDYNDFVISGEMTSLELKAEKPCP
jgi:hypothetical protein